MTEEMNFDSWGNYIPFGDTDLKEIAPKEENNPNLIKLLINDEFEVLGGDKEYFEETFDHYSEQDYNENVFMRFIKDEEKNGVVVFSSPKNQDIFLIVKDGKKYIVNSYQNSSYYFDDNKLTFAGWDDNLIINTDDMTMKTKNIR